MQISVHEKRKRAKVERKIILISNLNKLTLFPPSELKGFFMLAKRIRLAFGNIAMPRRNKLTYLKIQFQKSDLCKVLFRRKY